MGGTEVTSRALAIGGPLDGQIIAGKLFHWHSRHRYDRIAIKQGGRTQWVYLYRRLRAKPPQPEIAIRRFAVPAGFCPASPWDWDVLAHHWHLQGDEDRRQYCLFMAS